VVGQNTSCKAHKVCISLWPMGWDDMRTRADKLNWQVKNRLIISDWVRVWVKKGDGGLVEDLLPLCCGVILC